MVPILLLLFETKVKKLDFSFIHLEVFTGHLLCARLLGRFRAYRDATGMIHFVKKWNVRGQWPPLPFVSMTDLDNR